MWTFTYRYTQGGYDTNNDPADASCTSSNPECPNSQGIPLETAPVFRRSWIDAGYTNENAFPRVKNGVKMGEGDGTVSLLSLGAMCVEGWKKGRRWNPAGIKVVTVEVKIDYFDFVLVFKFYGFQLPHMPLASIPRGGANTSDHVDILGSMGLNEIILKVATGVGDEIGDRVVSKIGQYAQRIQWD